MITSPCRSSSSHNNFRILELSPLCPCYGNAYCLSDPGLNIMTDVCVWSKPKPINVQLSRSSVGSRLIDRRLIQKWLCHDCSPNLLRSVWFLKTSETFFTAYSSLHSSKSHNLHHCSIQPCDDRDAQLWELVWRACDYNPELSYRSVLPANVSSNTLNTILRAYTL